MNQPMNLPIFDSHTIGLDQEVAVEPATMDEFLDGRQEGLYEACLIIDRITRELDAHPAARAALQAACDQLRESIRTTEPSEIRTRVMMLVSAARLCEES